MRKSKQIDLVEIATKVLHEQLEERGYTIDHVGSSVVSVSGNGIDGIVHVIIGHENGTVEALYTHSAYAFPDKVVSRHIVRYDINIADPSFVDKLVECLRNTGD